MLKNRKEDIERVAVELFGKIDIAKVATFTQNRACSWTGKETVIDVKFNELAYTIINTSVFIENPDAKTTGILKAAATMTTYAVALYYGSCNFDWIGSLDDCISVLETIYSSLETIKNEVYGNINICKNLIDEIEKEKSSLIEKMNFSNESDKTESDIIDSLFA